MGRAVLPGESQAASFPRLPQHWTLRQRSRPPTAPTTPLTPMLPPVSCSLTSRKDLLRAHLGSPGWPPILNSLTQSIGKGPVATQGDILW